MKKSISKIENSKVYKILFYRSHIRGKIKQTSENECMYDKEWVIEQYERMRQEIDNFWKM